MNVWNMSNLHDIITDESVFAHHYLLRDGFEFRPLTHPANVYDAIVIRNPQNTQETFCIPKTEHSLLEHIKFINQKMLEKAIIYANDISFITQCPTLKYLSVRPADDAGDNFDFSPLYRMPEIKSLVCQTQYGTREEFSSSVDYSRISGLVDLGVCGNGHLNYSKISSLKSLFVSGYQDKDLTTMFNSSKSDMSTHILLFRRVEIHLPREKFATDKLRIHIYVQPRRDSIRYNLAIMTRKLGVSLTQIL